MVVESRVIMARRVDFGMMYGMEQLEESLIVFSLETDSSERLADLDEQLDGPRGADIEAGGPDLL